MRFKVLITGGSGFVGTNLINYFLAKYPTYELINLDSKPPRYAFHDKYWKNCNIVNQKKLLKIFDEFYPDYVIHLAAKASLGGKTINDFQDNIIGTRNMVNCINHTLSVKIFLHTSTQYVLKPGIFPESEVHFSPYTPYGASKAECEKIVRSSNLRCNWVILRPTNIWGPWHSFFPYELWHYLSKRFYFHPGFTPIKKHYGFIENSLEQIDKILHLKESKYLNQVYYITDPPIDNAEWMDAFSKALSGKKIRRIPRVLWKLFAYNGDLFNKCGFNIPLNSERYFRLTVNEHLPYQKTIDLVGSPSYSLSQGVGISLNWIKAHHQNLLLDSIN